ncbi:hypothetical protein E2C01_005434 [Portunus trituberculatus]|uniref:Uncharacterized protein n=1 Tax=Portunus trituberculatus TaxID=210409 RepID=A0A5B7CTI7_PORTR|nr:hypothetical protein [Portunus trituberculatus]
MSPHGQGASRRLLLHHVGRRYVSSVMRPSHSMAFLHALKSVQCKQRGGSAFATTPLCWFCLHCGAIRSPSGGGDSGAP